MSKYQIVFSIIWIIYFSWGFKLSAQNPVSPSIGKTYFTIDEITKFVELFNEVRSKVKPPAANMNYVQWDSELADNAYYDITGCGSNISSKKIIYKGNFTDVASIIENWSNESFNYNIQANKCIGQNSCINYIQMIHAEIKKIGCGIKYCSYKNEYLISCYLDQRPSNTDKPYSIGKPCTLCQSKFCYQNLCINKDLCYEKSLNCNCALICNNCEVLDAVGCKCQCKERMELFNCSNFLSNFENTSCNINNRENQTKQNHEVNGQKLEKEKNSHLNADLDITNSRKLIDDKAIQNNSKIKVDFAATTKIATVKTKIEDIITKEISNTFIPDRNTGLNYPNFTKMDKSIKSDDYTELYQPEKTNSDVKNFTHMYETEIVDITNVYDIKTLRDDDLPEHGKGKGFSKIWPNAILVVIVTTIVLCLSLNADKI